MHWLSTFRQNLADPDGIPWHLTDHLTPEEIHAITPSIQQFQLGENSEGRRLIARAKEWTARYGMPELVPTLELFIREEQRHSAWLAAFMDRHHIPRTTHHWIDGAFRTIRNLAGLELSLRILSTAEVIAVPYYTALGRATGSPLLRALCDRILEDEDRHLAFQAGNFARFDANRSAAAAAAVRESHRTFAVNTVLIVWFSHGDVLRRGGYGFRAFLDHSLETFDRMTSPLPAPNRAPAPTSSSS